MLIALTLFISVFADQQCSPLPNGIVINKYYLETCAACKRLNPILEEIKSQVSKAQMNIKFREIECTACECDGIANFPTLEITEDKELKGKTVGYKDYENLTKWIKETLSLDKEVFSNHLDHSPGLVKQLVARDFLTGFDNQWLILFYEDEKDVKRTLFKEIAKIFGDKLTVAEVNRQESQSVTARYNISDYPLILGINQGTPVPYAGKIDLPSLSQFVEKLVTPAFQEITYQELKDKTKGFVNGEPIYVVLYKNFEVASFYFNELAQQFKFKAQIYRSNDPAMFSASGFHPKDIKDFNMQDSSINHQEMVGLSLFKNGSFFPCPEKLENAHDIITWIFHTHFPHVTSINNENFYTVFHGIKPIVMLLTQGDNLVESFNKVSANWNLGSSSSNLIFSSLDSLEYPLFKKKILNGVKEPAILIYDPIQSKWYFRPMKLTDENMNKTVMLLVDQYFNGKLPIFPPKKKKINIYFLGVMSLLSVAVLAKYYSSSKKIID